MSNSLRPHGLQHASFPVLICLPEFAQIHVHWVSDVIQPSHPLSSSSPAFNVSQHQDLFQWVRCSHQVAMYWSFTFSISPSNEYSGLISFRIDWLDLFTVQETLKREYMCIYLHFWFARPWSLVIAIYMYTHTSMIVLSCWSSNFKCILHILHLYCPTWCNEPIHWKRPWCWERLRAGGEGGHKGWVVWMASPTQSTWVWANSGRQRRTRKPGVLQSMSSESQIWLSD